MHTNIFIQYHVVTSYKLAIGCSSSEGLQFTNLSMGQTSLGRRPLSPNFNTYNILITKLEMRFALFGALAALFAFSAYAAEEVKPEV